CLQYKGYPYSF
nr:immunoglobulin light chain junction region [Macaca mulatta]MOV82307.1 immunoglobulin light chain junction region [Macaca mulatta]MOV83881.1 immunoglobulin light chain junction region [Macaca mulatta]MOV84309.1 immunoglobulin light chain junction region [Macaca mulatta]